MTKLIIVLLAICLVSVHAFVKRDAPAAPDANILEMTQKKFQDLTKDFSSQISNIDPENIKTKFNEFFDSVNKAMGDLKPKEGAPAQ